jgi:glycosyltransferase involved in cell wall biosynthesis
MNNNPKISVCITVYNREEYITQCIESVLAQDYKNIEIIISDNCSTDKSVEIIKNFLSDKRIKFYQNESNIGMYRNFDLVACYSTGDYIAYLNADDYWNDNTFLSQAVNKINKFKDIVVFCGGKKYLYEQNATFEDLSDDTDGLFNGSEIFLKGIDAWWPFEIDAMVINAAVLKNIYKENKWDVPGDDVYFFWRLCLQGQLYILRKPFLTFRHHESNYSKWKSIDDYINRLLCNISVPIKAYGFAIKKNMFPKQIFDKWLIKNIILFMTASYCYGWDKFNILKNAYDNILIEKGYSVSDFGIESMFNRLYEINIFENNIYYSEDNANIENIQNCNNLDNANYFFDKNIESNFENKNIANENNAQKKVTVDLLRSYIDKIGYIKYDDTIKANLMKSGISEKSIRDFFDVFIYSKIYNYFPAELKNLNFVEKKLSGFINKPDYENISDFNSDIFGEGWVLNIEEAIFQPDKVYLLLVQNYIIKYYINTNLFKKYNILYNNTLLSMKCGFSYIIPSHAILSGVYSYMILFVKDNYASILETNKILKLSS